MNKNLWMCLLGTGLFLACSKSEPNDWNNRQALIMLDEQATTNNWYITGLSSNTSNPSIYNGPFISDSVPLPPAGTYIVFSNDSLFYNGICSSASYQFTFLTDSTIKTKLISRTKPTPGSWIDLQWDSDVISSLDSAYQIKIQNTEVTISSTSLYNLFLLAK